MALYRSGRRNGKMQKKQNIHKKNATKLNIAARKSKADRELFGIIGLGRFGMSLAANLAQEGAQLLVVDRVREKINAAAAFCENAYVCDDLSKKNLEDLGFGECDTVIVAIGRALDTSVLTTLNLTNMGVKRVIAKANSAEQGMVLEKLGAEVVYPERDMGERLAGKLSHPNVLDYITLGQDVDIAQLKLSARADRMKVIALDLRRRFSLNMIAITKEDGATTADIGPETMLFEGDVVSVIGNSDNIERFEAWLCE